MRKNTSSHWIMNSKILEKQPIPLAVYQFVDRHVYTLALSDGFLELFGYTDRADAYSLSNQNALYNTHPDDVGRVGDAVHRFALEGGRYEVIFRAKRHVGQRSRLAILFTASASTSIPIRV